MGLFPLLSSEVIWSCSPSLVWSGIIYHFLFPSLFLSLILFHSYYFRYEDNIHSYLVIISEDLIKNLKNIYIKYQSNLVNLCFTWKINYNNSLVNDLRILRWRRETPILDYLSSFYAYIYILFLDKLLLLAYIFLKCLYTINIEISSLFLSVLPRWSFCKIPLILLFCWIRLSDLGDGQFLQFV